MLASTKHERASNLLFNHLREDQEESCRTLPSYLFIVKQVNKYIITHLETDSSGRFKYMFLAYGICIYVFRRMRKVITINETFFRGKI